MPKPKRGRTIQVRFDQAFISKVKERFQGKKGIKPLQEAIRLYSDEDWKRALVQREDVLKKKSDEKCDRRVESYVKRIAKLEIDLKASNSKIEASNSKVIEKNSENEKLKWQLKANLDIARAEIVQKDSEITQKESENAKLKAEIVKLKAEIEKGPSSEIMKEYSEMKERNESLESQLNEAQNKARVLVYDERL